MKKFDVYTKLTEIDAVEDTDRWLANNAEIFCCVSGTNKAQNMRRIWNFMKFTEKTEFTDYEFTELLDAMADKCAEILIAK
jgi:predicted aldo/keto reductase-like oxidoreductase